MLSILTSGVGIANGLYIANHLSFTDVEDVDLNDQVMPPDLTNKFGAELPESQPSKIGPQPMTLPQPPGLQPMALPQPPGLGKTHRKPGQFVSDTEWRQNDFKQIVGGGFKYFFISTLPGKMIQFD